MKKQNTVGWSELLYHGEELGFFWNYSHELLRIFLNYTGVRTIYCDNIDNYIPMNARYIGSFKENNEKDGNLNQMGRDIVYDFMQKHKISEMLVYNDK